MSKETQQKIIVAVPGILLILVASSSLTYGARLAVNELNKPKYTTTHKVVEVTETPKAEAPAAPTTASKNPSASSTSSSAATTAPAATSTTPATPTATTNSFVYLRPTASTLGQPLKDLQAGTVVQYETKATGLWQKVTVDGVTGYVYKKWLTY